MPHHKWGETPIAAVRLVPRAAETGTELREWLNERVAARFQKVSEVMILDEFPLGIAGKTLRRVLRDAYIEENQSR